MTLPVHGWLRRLLGGGAVAPLVGVQCLQGGGKSTLCAQLETLFAREGRRCVVASIDDFYKTDAELRALEMEMPDEPLLHGRGNPGTHDVQLMEMTLQRLRTLKQGESMRVPRYDKSAHGGRGDRLPESQWPTVTGPIDLVIIEGWCLGFSPLGASSVPPALQTVDRELAGFAPILAALDGLVLIQATRLSSVYKWREEAEEARRRLGEGALSREDLVRFVDRYMPAYKAYLPQLYAAPSPNGRKGPGAVAEERTLRFWIDEERRPVPTPPEGHDPCRA